MVDDCQRRILQIWLCLTPPNPQTTRLEHFDVHAMRVLFLDTPHAYFLLMWFGGRRHYGQQGQQGGDDQGGRWH